MPMPLDENDKFPDDSQVVDNEDENAQARDSEAEAVEQVSGSEFDSPGPSPSPHSSAWGLAASPHSCYPAEPGSPLSGLLSSSSVGSVGGAAYVDSPDLAVLDATYLQSLYDRGFGEEEGEMQQNLFEGDAEEEQGERQPGNQDWGAEEVSWDTTESGSAGDADSEETLTLGEVKKKKKKKVLGPGPATPEEAFPPSTGTVIIIVNAAAPSTGPAPPPRPSQAPASPRPSQAPASPTAVLPPDEMPTPPKVSSTEKVTDDGWILVDAVQEAENVLAEMPEKPMTVKRKLIQAKRENEKTKLRRSERLTEQ